MNIPPLCIIQARYHSTRLPGKMLLPLGDETLIARAWRIACEAFGPDNCVVAIPDTDVGSPLDEELRRIGANCLTVPHLDENDVLGRFYRVAHLRRWHPDSVIVRYTPDDPFKTVDGLRRVAAGERLPVEIGGEAFTLGMLDAAHVRVGVETTVLGDYVGTAQREHITYALFDTLPTTAPEGQVRTIDTQADLDAARAIVEEQTATGRQRETWAPDRELVSPFDGGHWGQF